MLLALYDGEAAGAVGVKGLSNGYCEMKRLFARPGFRGKRVGFELVSRIIEEARKRGYSHMRLDTLPAMEKAISLYTYFGFKEIYLIGVDLNYTKPDNLVTTQNYGVPIFDMESDDPNHFHRDYFGKGYRWHEPQQEKMGEAFEKAGRVCCSNGVKVFNAGIGGKLHCFPRVEFLRLFC